MSRRIELRPGGSRLIELRGREGQLPIVPERRSEVRPVFGGVGQLESPAEMEDRLPIPPLAHKNGTKLDVVIRVVVFDCQAPLEILDRSIGLPQSVIASGKGSQQKRVIFESLFGDLEIHQRFLIAPQIDELTPSSKTSG